MEVQASAVVVGKVYCRDEERELTVRKTSLFSPGDGFDAYDHHTGDLIFRVDTYGQRLPLAAEELVLMDSAGAPLLTVRRKLPSLHQRWEGFLGDRQEGQSPLFTVRRSSIFGSGRTTVSVEVHGSVPPAEYRVEGSFAHRCCRLLYEVTGAEGGEQESVMAEIKRKVDPCAHVVLGRDVFSLRLRPGFDAAFAMGVVLVLNQISGDDDVDIDDLIVGGPVDGGDREDHGE